VGRRGTEGVSKKWGLASIKGGQKAGRGLIEGGIIVRGPIWVRYGSEAYGSACGIM
jgi:hypothetical protein